jgi:hypothetical protein
MYVSFEESVKAVWRDLLHRHRHAFYDDDKTLQPLLLGLVMNLEKMYPFLTEDRNDS